MVVRADVGFCRDKISDRKDLSDQIEGTSKVVFLGANGAEVEVECPKVGVQVSGSRPGYRGGQHPVPGLLPVDLRWMRSFLEMANRQTQLLSPAT